MSPRIAVIAIAKNEAAYLPHWIAHHLFFGFDEFYLWVNGTTDNSFAILEKIENTFPNIHIYNGDSLLRECHEQKINFQEEAYAYTISHLSINSNVTHALFIDIDEFWTPSTFDGSIKDSVRNIHADVISFLWHVDIPDYSRAVFSDTFEEKCLLQKDMHVKSMIKLSSAIVRCHTHTCNVENGSYALGNGLSFPANGNSTDFNVEDFSKVNDDYLTNANRYVETSFIYHRVNRSTTEYLSSLLRGRAHALDNSPFKTNRLGYVNESTRIVDFVISKDNLKKYKDHYASFVKLCGIKEDMGISLNNIMENYNHVVSLFRERPDLIQKYANIFRGINYETPKLAHQEYKDVKSFIDAIIVKNFQVTIIGWAFSDVAAVMLPKIFISQNEYDYTFEIVDRPDVKEKFDHYTSHCGFNIKLDLPKTIKIRKEDILIIF